MVRISASTAFGSGGSPGFSDLSGTNAMASAAPGVATQQRPQLVDGPRVENVFGRCPGPPGHLDTPTQVAEGRDRMRVSRNHQPCATLEGKTGMRVVEIEPVHLAVDLERDAALRR